MPNWCENQIELNHADHSMIEKAAKALEEGTFMETFNPTPDDMLDGEEGDGPMPKWYTWRLENWGTKWDVQSDGFDVCEGELNAYFSSAWIPPLAFYKTLEKLGFTVRAKYHEGGMGFCGYFNGEHIDYMDYESIPEDIREDFSIEPWDEEELIASEG